jgi:hypothetical protein
MTEQPTRRPPDDHGLCQGLQQRETLTLAEFLSSNIIVIFDNRPGEYEAGNYIVIEQE